jgi:hypothetical protein
MTTTPADPIIISATYRGQPCKLELVAQVAPPLGVWKLTPPKPSYLATVIVNGRRVVSRTINEQQAAMLAGQRLAAA